MDIRVLLLIGAGIALLFYTRKLQFDGVFQQYYPKNINSSEWANYNYGGAGQ